LSYALTDWEGGGWMMRMLDSMEKQFKVGIYNPKKDEAKFQS
jgi:hypothetical protein